MRRHPPGARAVPILVARAVVAVTRRGRSRRGGLVDPPPAGASGILPPSNPVASVPPPVMPHCTYSPVNDNSDACINSILHNINYAWSLEGIGSMVLPAPTPRTPWPMQQLILTDEERGDRGLSQFSGLDPALNTAAQAGAVAAIRPGAAQRVPVRTPGARSSPSTTPLWVPTSPGCTTTAGAAPTSTVPRRAPRAAGVTATTSSGPWTTTANQTAQMGDGDTSTPGGAGQYAQIFVNEKPTPGGVPGRHLDPELAADAGDVDRT